MISYLLLDFRLFFREEKIMEIRKEFNLLKNDKPFFRRTVLVAVPIVLQQLLMNVLNLVDTLMIGQLGETSIAAVGIANKVFFVFTLLLFGICSGSSVLESQFWGKRDVHNIRRMQGIALTLSVLASLFFLVPAILCPQFIMRIFTNSEPAIEIGAQYLRVVALSYPLTAVTQVYVITLRSINQVKAPVVVTLISICVNIFFNYMFIFGKFGAPALEAKGAAIATLIARCAECVILLVIVYIGKGPAASGIKEMASVDKKFLRLFFVTATPVILNEFMWGLGVTMYSLVYGRMGDAAMATITITQSIEQVAQVVFMGLGSAAGIILGNELGSNKLKDAERHAKYFIGVQFILTAFTMVIFYAVRMSIIGLFNVTPEAAQSVNLCFIVFILYLPAKVFNLINIVGILRSGGDTKAALVLDCTGVWCIGIPMAVLGGLILKQPIHIVYAMVLSEEIYKFIFGYNRYRKKKWCKNLVSDK